MSGSFLGTLWKPRRLTLAALLSELLPGISPEAGRKGIRSSVGLHLRAGFRVQGAILELGAAESWPCESTVRRRQFAVGNYRLRSRTCHLQYYVYYVYADSGAKKKAQR